MKQRVTTFLNNQIHKSSIGKQYLALPQELSQNLGDDPLMEDTHEVVKGLIHKYTNRALIKISYECAAHCRFCTRIRQIGNKEGRLNTHDIENIKAYLTAYAEIEDVILSGGDPLLIPNITIEVLNQIQQIPSIKVLRIGTRLPLQSPKSVYTKANKVLFELIANIQINKPFHILLHINHPDELTQETKEAIAYLQKETKATFFAQTVFLKAINIDFLVLERLFKNLYFMNVLPYYIYHCDKVKGLERFEGDLEKEKLIMQQLRKSLSGLACPTFVVDISQGYGKMPVNLDLL